MLHLQSEDEQERRELGKTLPKTLPLQQKGGEGALHREQPGPHDGVQRQRCHRSPRRASRAEAVWQSSGATVLLEAAALR